MDVKWIKLTTDMFDNKKIKYIRTLPEGNNIVLIWVMLLTMAGRCNSGGMIFLTENIPYTPKILADEIGFDENVVKLALMTLEQLDMVYMSGAHFCISGWEEHQNIDGLEKIREQNRERQAKFKANKRQLMLSNVTGNVSGNVTVTQGNATDIDKEIEQDKELDIKPIARKRKDADANFDIFWDAYPNKKGKDAARKAFAKVDVPIDTLLDAIAKQKQSKQWTKDEGQYIPYPATWLNQGRWQDEVTQTAIGTNVEVQKPVRNADALRALLGDV